MKIILLASNPSLYSNKRILEAAKSRGHKIDFVNVGGCFLKVAPGACEIFGDDGNKLEGFDCVVPRIKPAMTFYGTTILRQFELLKIACCNGSDGIANSRDKFRALQILASNEINIPDSSFANSAHDTRSLIKLVGGAPLVVKLLEGTKGVGVVLAETSKAAESMVNAFRSVKADVLVQHYIKESKGCDIRCFVIGDKVVAAIERIAQEGEFRANIHLGATARPIKISEAEQHLAIKAAKVIGLEIAGVDIVRSEFGPKILEINSSPGLEGIETATNIDIADKIIDHIEKITDEHN